MGDHDPHEKHPRLRLLSSLFFVASAALLVGWRETGSTMDRIALGLCVVLTVICWFGPFPLAEQKEATTEELEWECERHEHRVMVCLLQAFISICMALVLFLSASPTKAITTILIGCGVVLVQAVMRITLSMRRLNKLDTLL